MQLSDFDFHLPPELIAQHPTIKRSSARLLDGTGVCTIVDRLFTAFPSLLRTGDLLVFNDTQVVKARFFGAKETGGALEVLVERVLPSDEGHPHEVIAQLRVSKKPAIGARLVLGQALDGVGFEATMLGRVGADDAFFHLRLSDDPYALMDKYGHVPLPPYIAHADSAEDASRYQTVFAKHPGAVAAPTAALHFDEDILTALDAQGVQRASITLHVGAGTFQPVKVQNLGAHTMHHERYAIPDATLKALSDCKARKGKVVAVGTTTARTLETYAKTGQARGDTNLFITPGFRFEWVDYLLTNFHLPKSTLLMLVSAFAGHPHVRAMYQHAVEKRYRFFSYGDAMLLAKA